MKPVQQITEDAERAYVHSDEIVGAMPTLKQPKARTGDDDPLHGIEMGLYPVCATCGQRIEIERLRQDAETRDCARCAAA